MTAQASPQRSPVGAGAPVVVRLTPVLITLFPDADRVLELHAGSVSELVDALDQRWPGMRDRICDTRPAIRQHMNVFVDGKRAKLDTALTPGADVFILTAISGG